MAFRSLTSRLLRRLAALQPGDPPPQQQAVCVLQEFVGRACYATANEGNSPPESNQALAGPSRPDVSGAQLGRDGEAANDQARASEENADFDQEEMREFEQASQGALQDVVQRLQGTEPPKYVFNLAGEGRSGWKMLWRDADEDRYLWMLDMTGGKVPDNENNALLSPRAKNLMKLMHMHGCDLLSLPFCLTIDFKEELDARQQAIIDGTQYNSKTALLPVLSERCRKHDRRRSVEYIANYFRVRQQRVLAILALQHIDEERQKAGEPMYWDFQREMEGDWGVIPDGSDRKHGVFECTEMWGSGERHVRLLPKAPHYETKVANDGSTIHRNLEQIEEEVAVQEEQMMVEEFADRLFFNMGLRGQKLKRQSARSHRPKRPKNGFSLVVKPKQASESPYVAEPGGKLRDLNQDEQVLQQRQTVRRRRKYI